MKRERKKPMYTNFFYAYEQYKKTQDYDRSLRMFLNCGIAMPYADNWVHSIFSAGWGNRPIVFVNENGEEFSINEQ